MNSHSICRAPLDDFGLLTISGPEASKFLQGQVTCDVDSLSDNNIIHGAHCTAKGRTVANFDLIKVEERLYLRLPKNAIDGLQSSLDKYIVFSKADCQNLSDDYQLIGLQGSEIYTWFENTFAKPLQPGQFQLLTDGAIAIGRDDQRIEYWIDKAINLPADISQLPLAAQGLWQRLDIEYGQGWITSATSDEFLPQALNLQTPELNGINFKKGCYTGQEIVARAHYRGSLKKSLFRFETVTGGNAVPGMSVLRVDTGQSVGTLVNCAEYLDRLHLLAIVNHSALEAELTLANNDCPDFTIVQKLQQAPLPYAISIES